MVVVANAVLFARRFGAGIVIVCLLACEATVVTVCADFWDSQEESLRSELPNVLLLSAMNRAGTWWGR